MRVRYQEISSYIYCRESAGDKRIIWYQNKFDLIRAARVAQWIRRTPPKGEIVGSSPIVGIRDHTPCESDCITAVQSIH